MPRHETSIRRTVSAAAGIACIAWAATGSAAEPICAAGVQGESLRALLAKPDAPQPFAVARELKIPEALAASALPPGRGHGVAASNFEAIWKSLQTWESATFVVMKGGNVFETRGRVFPGEPSTRSKYFNLHGEGPGVSGHLRPDLLSAIYVVQLPGKEATVRGVLFYDENGDVAFAVYAAGVEGEPPESLIRQYEATAAEIRKLPAVCATQGK
jgi:putative heme iron utilization protein